MTAAGRPDLRLRQRSMWSAYPLEVLAGDGRPVGMLDWPGAGAGGGAGARARPGVMPLDLHGRRYGVEHRALPAGWSSGRRLVLRGPDGSIVASLDIPAGASRQRAAMLVTQPVQGEVSALPSTLRMVHAVRLADGRAGSVQEPSWLSLRRTLDVRLPRSDDALRAFLGAAVLIARTSNTNARW